MPDGALLVLLNAAGEPAEARLRMAPGVHLMRLTLFGEEAVPNPGETLELTLDSQSVLVFRCTGCSSEVE